MSALRAVRGDLVSYVAGTALALALTLAAFAVVRFRLASPGAGLAIVLGLGFLQIVTHMRFFLHISVRRSARSDLMLVLFSVLIIALMVGGTLVVLANLRARMM